MLRNHAIVIILMGASALLSACAGPSASGYGPVRIETFPLDGNCLLFGTGYSMRAKAPADLVVPLSANPVKVTCETDSGYKGSETLAIAPGPWSPGNVGLGFLNDEKSTRGHRYPELLRVTMLYTEAGKPKDIDKPIQSATGAEMSAQMPKLEAAKKTVKAKSAETEAEMLVAKIRKKTQMAKSKDEMAKDATMKEEGMKDAHMKDAAMKDAPKKEAAMKDVPMKDAAIKKEANTAKKLATTSNVRVHLSSFRKRENAERNWRSLSRTQAKLLNGLSSSIESVDLGKKGRFHRLYASGFENSKAARDLCNAFKKQKLYCRPVRASGN